MKITEHNFMPEKKQTNKTKDFVCRVTIILYETITNANAHFFRLLFIQSRGRDCTASNLCKLFKFYTSTTNNPRTMCPIVQYEC